ncbi:AcrB/AcrD/AcrF family protein [Motiliproteus coralliicola]|uniref:AcrB/AcrD/AcrF family protein n=1 Tax=Motiliproteus coralliicola TaxID=2283196 RepID=A0A369WCS9_9GAMM|nr:efflux RND transporter permease subunit [Motiliproteus coralliicola]RDE18416.1 AcrB/AcrD/AcrF family protein [Motiliproteus coralliicola]
MIRFFAAHPTAANLLMGMFMLAGVLALPDIKRETFPEIDRYEVQVTVAYPGASPTDVELGICKPLEDAIDGISFMEEKRCEARDSVGIMTLKMLESGDFDRFLDDTKSAVDGIDNFPDDSELPVVEETGRTQDVVTLALSAELPARELKTLAEQLKQRMQQTTAIPLIEIQGFASREFQIHVPQHNLRQYGLSLEQIADIVRGQNLDMPDGELSTARREYQIRFSDEKRTTDELAKLIVIDGEQGGELRLGDIATIHSDFDTDENRVTYNGKPAAFLQIRKNSIDDSLDVLEQVKRFIDTEQHRLPPGVELALTQDSTSIIKDRIQMLGTNAWQGLLLVFAVMWLFFGTRYAFWVVMGLPVSFLASAFVLGQFGMSINMLSMVALLLALGVLMDDAIVISESIGHQIRQGRKPLQAAIEGTRLVARGVFSSFLTTLCIFSGLLSLTGDIGQILVVIPIVLISVISVSLIEAFFILPHHLYHSLAHARSTTPSLIQAKVNALFERLRLKIDQLVGGLIRIRYGFVGAVIALLIVSISLLPSGIVKFSAFPTVEGDILQARVLMPTGTPLHRTEALVTQLKQQLNEIAAPLSEQQGEQVIKAVTVKYGTNADAFESGPHLATLSVDLLTAEQRHFSINELKRQWLERAEDLNGAWSIAIKEPSIGPAGRAIEIRLQGSDLDRLSQASQELKHWLAGYPGVSNLLDDLRPGKPEFTLHLKEGAYSLGMTAQTISSQLRAAFQGAKVLETSIGLETYDLVVELDKASRDELADFDNFPIINPANGAIIPLGDIAEIVPTRSYSRIHRVDNQRTLTLLGDIDASVNNTAAVLGHMQANFLPEFKQRYPDVSLKLKGEVAEGGETQGSMKSAFLMGLAGIFVLLSFQFRSYLEPVIVMLNIPLALIGVIWGHWLLGLDITMPSMLGFVSLAGIVVNDSILLVEFVKRRVAEGLSIHAAAARASHDRFRAVLLTSLTTIAGMTPLLFETSLQAQVLIPLTVSIVFGIASSTLLVLFVVPCCFCILEDFGLTSLSSSTAADDDNEGSATSDKASKPA